MSASRRRFLTLAGSAAGRAGAPARGLCAEPAGDAQAAPFPAAGRQRAGAVPDALGAQGRGGVERPHQDRHLPVHAARRRAAAALRSGPRRGRGPRLDADRLYGRAVPEERGDREPVRVAPHGARELARLPGILREPPSATNSPRCIRSASGRTTAASSMPTSRIEKLEDLKGVKIRFPTRLAGEALKALGATSVGMPVPQVPESIAQRVIDGALMPWEVVPVGQARRAGQVPHRHPGPEIALHQRHGAGDEQGEIRGPARGSEGRSSTRIPARSPRAWLRCRSTRWPHELSRAGEEEGRHHRDDLGGGGAALGEDHRSR